jgi:WG containing repeat
VKNIIKFASLIALILLDCLPCNAEWIDKTGKVVEGPVKMQPEPRGLFEGMVVFGPEFSPQREGKQREGKYGFKNGNGEIVIPAKFAEAGVFHDGLAPVFFKGKWFYIDKKGKAAIKLPVGCSFAGVFNDGLAAIVLRNGSKLDDRVPKSGDRLGYVDQHGKLAIPAKYRFVFAWDSRFSEGLAAVIPSDAVLLNYGYINRNDEWVIGPRFLKASPFHDGKAFVTAAGTEFSTGAWNNHDPMTGYTRERQFQIFLATHHLLGLSKNSVQKYLGSPSSTSDNIATYALESNCTTALNVELFYIDDVVAKYRYKAQTKYSSWINIESADHSELSPNVI